MDGKYDTLTPLPNLAVDRNNVGGQSKLSKSDVRSLAKAYSCAGRVATYGGGYAQVQIKRHKYIVQSN